MKALDRILHIPGGTLNRNNGIATFIMNVYRNIDKTKYQFDFIVFTDEIGEYEDEILSLGGEIYHVERPGRNLLKNMMQTYAVMKENGYCIMHRHTAEAHSWSDFYVAKKSGIKYRVAHSHGTHTFKPITHKIFYPFMIKNVTERLTCSEKAGIWLFHDRESFKVVKNGIQTERFVFSKETRDSIRRDLGLAENTLVLGSAGRLAKQKNPLMTVRVFSELLKKNSDSILIMLGEGNLKSDIEALISELGIEEKVMLPGVTSEVEQWMCAMDVAIYPSEFEGFPFSVLESQANGLPVIMSDRITSEVNVLGTVIALPLEESPEHWAEEILRLYSSEAKVLREECAQAVLNAGYDIKNTAKDLENYYEQLLR